MTNIKDALDQIVARSKIGDDDDEKEIRRQCYHIETIATQALSSLTASPDREKVALANELERLCCAETEGKFFDAVTNNIQTIIVALRCAKRSDGGTELTRLRFFRDLVERERIKVYKAFNVLPRDYSEPLTLGFEGKLFDAILSTIAPDEAAIDHQNIDDDWIMNVVHYSTVGSGAIPKSEWCAFARAIVAALDASIRTDEREKQKERDAEIAHQYAESLGPKEKWPLEKMQAGLEIAAAIRSQEAGR